MTSTAQAGQLHQRARHLRNLAGAIESSPVLSLNHHADEDTWRGRKPALCRAVLATNQQQLHAAAEDLRWQAYLFDQQARQIEIMARRDIGLVG